MSIKTEWNENLTAFWIVPGRRSGPIGIGVTACDLNDAMGLIRAEGYELDAGNPRFSILEGVRPGDLDSYVGR